MNLQQAARDHLWLHFTRMGGYQSAEIPIIVSGDGCYLTDSNGKRYLDALAGLFTVNIGYGFGEEMGQAALEQMRELPFYTNWSYAHPRAIELAAEIASLAPGDLNRVFFVSGGSEAVESAWKLARQYYLARGGKKVPSGETRHDERVGTPPPRKYKAIARADRLPRDDDGGALDQRHPVAEGDVRAARARGAAREEHQPLPPAARGDRGGVHRDAAGGSRGGDPRDGARDDLPRPHGARAERGRRLHAAGGLLARRPRALRPLRHPALGRRGDHRVRPRRPLVRLRALRHPSGHRLLREGALVRLRGDRRRHRHRPGDGAVPRGRVDVLARDHVRRPPGHVRDRAEEHRDHEAGADHGARARKRGRVPLDARDAARPADRRRRARDRLLLRARARQEQGDARDVQRRRVRDAPARLPLRRALRARADLPRRRPRRPGDPDLAAARSPARPSSTRSSGSWATCSRRPGSG